MRQHLRRLSLSSGRHLSTGLSRLPPRALLTAGYTPARDCREGTRLLSRTVWYNLTDKKTFQNVELTKSK